MFVKKCIAYADGIASSEKKHSTYLLPLHPPFIFTFSPFQTLHHQMALLHLTDVFRVVLGDFPKQTKLSPHSVSLSDYTPPPCLHPSRLSALSLFSLRFHTNESAACSSHSLASETQDIFSLELHNFILITALARQNLRSAKTHIDR